MDKTYHAILIGLNKYLGLNDLRYAEKDANDLYKVLTDKEIGLFPEDNVQLLIGKDATWHKIRGQLENKVLKRTPEDTILVYYAGHSAFIDDKVYLLSSDLSVEDIEQNKLTYAFMSLIGLRDSVVRESKAKNVIVILDTCQSGAIISNKRGETFTPQNLHKRFDDVFQNSQITLQDDQSRSILVSSPPTSPSLEDIKLENGLFTHCILDGLRGGTINTVVTVDSLIRHVKDHELLKKNSQIPGSYSFGFGQVILSKPKVNNNLKQTNIISIDDSRLEKISKYPELNPFSGPLDDYVTVIEQIFEKIDLLGPSLEYQLLESIRVATNANKAFLLIKTHQNWDIVCQDRDKFTDIEQVFEILAALKAKNAGTNAFSGSIIGFNGTTKFGENKTALLFPFNNIRDQSIFVLIGDETITKKFSTDIFGHIIQGIFYGLEKTQKKTTHLIKAHLLDYLKTYYKYLPKKLYDIRHDLFVERLHKMSVKFQPIICFSMKEPYISGFEALASDRSDENSTPHDLMTAAELWGDHFKIHLDQYFFEKSIETYIEQLHIAERRRPEDILDISINVYPESLIRTKYFERVKAIMDKKLLPKRKLHLEISEKSPLPEVLRPGDGIVTKKMKSFRDVLYRYVDEIGVGFTIDDFGIGHSSVSRLAQLTPNYLKIDREILTTDTVSQTISFIMNYAHTIVSQRILESAKIVVEGFDEEIHNNFISLPDLLDLGVEYIQGYIIGFPTEEIIRLDKEKRLKLFEFTKKR